MNKTVLITGSGGFIGHYLAKHFFQRGCRVIGCDRAPRQSHLVSCLHEYFSLDVTDESAIQNVIRSSNPDYCIHAAGRSSVGESMTNPEEDFLCGPLATFTLLNAIRRHAPRCKTVFLSSAAVYGNPVALPVDEKHPVNPLSAYGFHKWQSELICREFASLYGVQTASGRIFSAYGPGLKRQVVWDITRKMLASDHIQLFGTGGESRDFIHIDDIVHAVALIIERASFHGEAYNIASGVETTIRELAEMIRDHVNKDITILFDGNNPIGNPNNWRADIRLLIQAGFQLSVPLDIGIESFVRWAKGECKQAGGLV